MGGAARNEKRRRQDEASRKLAAAGIKVNSKSGPNRTVIIMVAVVVVFALLVGGFIFWQRSGSTGDVAAGYPVAVSGAVVTAGTGPVVVETYEDFLCPQCERFETRYSDEITTALNENKITVKYHTIAILDRATEPQGYSTRAANAALCAAAANIYPGYHDKLFAEQPAEGSAGLTDEQLIKFGTDLGAGADFGTCVSGGTNSAAVGAETDKAAADEALKTDGNFGTPTVVVNGKKIDLNDTGWLKTAIGA